MHVATYFLLCATVFLNTAIAESASTTLDFSINGGQFFITAPDGYALGEYADFVGENGGILVQMDPGEGLLLYGPVISGQDSVSHIQCSISSTPSGAQVVLGALNIPADGELSDADGSIGTIYGIADSFPRWTEIDLFYEPVDSSFVPVVQVVNTSSVAVDVYLAGLKVTPLFELAAADLGKLLDIPTPRPTPIPPFSGAGTPVAWPQTGHYYAIIEGAFTWYQAQWEAGLLWNGTGYLATVTSQEENDFLLSTFGSERLIRNWLGGIKAPLDSSSSQPVWQWANGEDWAYTNWAPGRPLYGGDDTFVLEYGSVVNSPGSWADRYINARQGFIAEWDSDPFSGSRVSGTGGTQLVPQDGSTVVIELDEPSDNIVIASPEGYEQAAYTYGEIPEEITTSGLQRIYSNGLGMTATLSAGQGITVYGPSIATGNEAALVQCRIRTDTPGALVTLATLHVDEGSDLSTFNGIMAANTLANGEILTAQWRDLQVIYNQRDGDLVPVIQAVADSDNPVSVYIDRIVITPLENLAYNNAQELLPIPTIAPTPTPALNSWSVESHRIPNMLGEVRIQFVDANNDGNRDILIANSGTRDFDPSFQVMFRTGPGVYQRAEPLLERDWVPGLHTEVVSLPHDPALILDVRPGTIKEMSPNYGVNGSNLRIFNILQRRYVRSEPVLTDSDLKVVSEWAWARTIPLAIEQLLTQNRSRIVMSLGKVWDQSYNFYGDMTIASTIREFEIEGDTILPIRDFNTETLDDSNDYLITSIAAANQRTFMLAETIFYPEDDTQDEVTRGTSLLELSDTNDILPLFHWPEGNGGHLTVLENGGGGNFQLIARLGSTVRLFSLIAYNPPIEIWTGTLDRPRVSGGYALGHTTPKTFKTVHIDDALAMTFHGELLTGDFNNDGITDLLSYANGLEYLPGLKDVGFGESIPLEMNFYPTDVCVEDMDDDGDDDIIASSGSKLRFYFQNGSVRDSGFVLPQEQQGEVTTLAGVQFPSGPNVPIQLETEFQQARRLVTLGEDIFVSDTAANRVLRRTADGNWHDLSAEAGGYYLLSSPTGLLALDDRLLICDSGNHRILEYLFNTNSWSVMAGIGSAGHLGDGGPAISASLNFPCDLLRLSDGRILVADTGNNTLRVIDHETGQIDAFFPADFEPQLEEPVAITAKSDHEIFVTESKRARIRRFIKTGSQWTSELAAGGRFGNDNIEMESGTSLAFPEKVVLLPDGRLLIADTGNQRLILRSESGYKWLAGSGVEGYQIDGVPLNVFHFSAPADIAIRSATEFLVTDGQSIRLLRIGIEAIDEVPLPWVNPTATPSPTPTAIPVNEQNVAGPVRWEQNGHYYALVYDRLSWTEARAKAQELYDGTGDLAAVTYDAENDFLVGTFRWDLISGAWLGGYQDPRLDEYNEILYSMGWRWTSGESWGYTYWASREPDNRHEADCLAYESFSDDSTSEMGAWCDNPEAGRSKSVVEWDHNPLENQSSLGKGG